MELELKKISENDIEQVKKEEYQNIELLEDYAKRITTL